ncbi:hypothetical protein KEM52_002218, partial [Ascosphaera acerosa]
PDHAYGPAPAGSPSRVLPYEAAKDFASVLKLWHLVLPGARLRALLQRSNGAHFVVRTVEKDRKTPVVGFAATYKDAARAANYVAALLVHPAYQRRGLGSQLLDAAAEHLRRTTGRLRVAAGSGVPRFFPGVPLDLPAAAYDFFVMKGFVPERGPAARDYVISLKEYKPPKALEELARKAGVAYRALQAEEEAAACLAAQRELFGGDAAWVRAYEALVAAGKHRQIMAATLAGRQVGWALMTDPDAGAGAGGPGDELALPPLLGDKTGVIACVGVHPDARRRGVGLGLLAAAAEDMKRRGLKVAWIDGVNALDWYEKVGARVWREYRALTTNSYIPRGAVLDGSGSGSGPAPDA